MGAGASFENGLGAERDQFFCHSCHQIFMTSFTNPSDMACPHCDSAFVEEVQGARHHDLTSTRRGVNSSSQLTTEQSRRISNATIMLRLLETQLREELEQLQQSFEADHLRIGERIRNGANVPVPKLSKIMVGKLRTITLDLDILCSQPSCPICSDDFHVHAEETKLPCGHLYHKSCVMPWLESKQNCPICRTSLTDEVPALADLESLPLCDLNNWVELMQAEDGSNNSNTNSSGDIAEGKGSAGLSAVPKVEHPDGADAKSEEGKEDTHEKRHFTKAAIAAKLQLQLLDYQRNRAEAERTSEQEQAALDAARQAHLTSLNGQMTRFINFSTGLASMAREDTTPSSASTSASALMGTAGQRSGAATGPGGGSMMVMTIGNRGMDTSLSPTRMAASLRNGIFPGSPSSSSFHHQQQHNHRHRHGTTASDDDETENDDNNYRGGGRAISGSTHLADGTVMRHRIRILDESSDEEDSVGEGAGNAELQEMYRRANASHMAQFSGANTVHALSTASSSSSSNRLMGGAAAYGGGGVSSSIGSALQRLGLHHAHSDSLPSLHTANHATATSTHHLHHHLSDHNVHRAFHRALHPEEADDDEGGEEAVGDWGRALAEVEESASARRRRSGFNSAAAATATALLGNSAASSASSGGSSPSTVSSSAQQQQQRQQQQSNAEDAVARAAEHHHSARAAMAPHAPTLTSTSAREFSSGSSGVASGSGGSGGSGGSERVNGASARLDQINNRVSAIDRYMTLSAPQLYGVNDVIANSGSTGINSSTVVGSSNTRADASAGIRTTNTTSITTYQVRATGGGGYATVPISGSQLNS